VDNGHCPVLKPVKGSEPRAQQIQFCHASIVGHCFSFVEITPLRLNHETQCYVLHLSHAKAYADHVVQISLAGVKAIREANRKSIAAE
jgi:TetR/AcrR family transcriptional regulator, regulator of cefoperazone and chloramphenicol sensitivity